MKYRPARTCESSRRTKYPFFKKFSAQSHPSLPSSLSMNLAVCRSFNESVTDRPTVNTNSHQSRLVELGMSTLNNARQSQSTLLPPFHPSQFPSISIPPPQSDSSQFPSQFASISTRIHVNHHLNSHPSQFSSISINPIHPNKSHPSQ